VQPFNCDFGTGRNATFGFRDASIEYPAGYQADAAIAELVGTRQNTWQNTPIAAITAYLRGRKRSTWLRTFCELFIMAISFLTNWSYYIKAK
jgi:hypothetical protein